MSSAKISVIIPVGPGESEWRGLLSQLSSLGSEFEVFVVDTKENSTNLQANEYIQWITAPMGRSWQLNQGAFSAVGDFFWFLHADSRMDKTLPNTILDLIRKQDFQFGYCSLKFRGGGTLMKLNEIGANLRSRFLGMPFGDQGFVISRKTFFALGGFDLSLPFAEDHHIVWKAHQHKIKLTPIDHTLSTSARKYKSKGWIKTTTEHLYFTTKQALPELKKVLLNKNTKQINAGLAIFVKTPELSPIKTRLANETSEKVAMDFFTRSVLAIDQVASRLNDIEIYWSVAEPQGMTNRFWKNHSRVWQGRGELGERQHATYQQLIHRHQKVLFLGSDSPQIDPTLIQDALRALDEHDFVVGPASDGGYYLFGGRKDLPKKLWQNVTYSKSDTCQQLLSEIRKHGTVHLLEVLTDVDTLVDLRVAIQELGRLTSKSPAQEELLDWFNHLTF